MRRNIYYFVLGSAVAATGLWAMAVDNLSVFKAGSPIKSGEVNQNFSLLKSAVEAPVSSERLADGAVTPSKLSAIGAADGKVLKLQEGKLAWSDDLMGSGGSAAYSAGVGLNLNSNIFSLADGGVTAEKLAAQNSPAASQFLAFNGSSLVWADGTSGSVGPQGPKGDKGERGEAGPAGPQGSKGDVGPQGPSGVASIADGSITSIKLANGGVSASKLGTQNPAAANKFLAFNGASLVWADGVSGTAGPQGPKGEKGDTGPAGTPGPKGDTGAPGPKGDTGPQGPVGPQGPSGIVADGSVTTLKLADGAVATNKLQNGSVTSNKLSPPLNLIGNDGNTVLQATNSNGGGLYGASVNQVGVKGVSTNGHGVAGFSTSNIGVYGKSDSGSGVFGESLRQNGVTGITESGNGVGGQSNSGVGVSGASTSGIGIKGISSTNNIGVLGVSNSGSGVQGRSSNGYAGEFIGGSGGRGICYYNGGAGWSCTSDKNAKENFHTINPVQVLDSLNKMPISTWNMKGDKQKTRHLGPTAQDFKKAFGLGNDDKTISTADAQGVAMAAIQGLYQKNQKLEQEVSRLKALEEQLWSLKKLEFQNQSLQAKLSDLEFQLASLKGLEKQISSLKALEQRLSSLNTSQKN